MATYAEFYTEHDHEGVPSAFLKLDGRLGEDGALERGKREAGRRNKAGHQYNRVRIVRGAYFGSTYPITELEDL